MSRLALRHATTAFILAITVQTTFVFFLAPVALQTAERFELGPWVFAAGAFTTMLLVVPSGRLSDAHPRRTILRLGLAMLALAYLLMAIDPTHPAAILAAAVLVGAGLAFTLIPFNSYIADVLAHEHITRAYGVSGALSVLASAMGPVAAAGVFLATPGPVAGLRAVALLFAATMGIAYAFTLTLPSERTAHTPPAFNPNPPPTRSLKPILVLNLIVGLGIGMTAPYFAVYFLDTLGLGGLVWALILAGSTLGGALGFYLSGVLVRRWKSRTLVVGGQALHLLATLPFLLPVGAGILAGLYMIRTLLSNAIAPLTNTIVMTRAAAAARGQAQGWTNLTWNLGWGLGALSGGFLLVLLGAAVFPLGAGLALLGALAGFEVIRRENLVRPTVGELAWEAPASDAPSPSSQET